MSGLRDGFVSGGRLGPPAAGVRSDNDTLAFWDAETGRAYNLTVAQLKAWIDAVASLSRLPAAEKDEIPDGSFLLETSTGQERLSGAALADFIDDAVRNDDRQGADGANAWRPTFRGVVDGENRLLYVDWVDGDGDKPSAGYITDTGALSLVKADAMDFRGAAGAAGGGTAVTFADQATAVAGLAEDEAMSPKTTAERYAAFKGAFADVTDADSDKWLPAGVFAALTPAQVEVLQRLLDVLTIDGHWRAVGGERTWGNAPIGVPFDSTLDVSDDADDLQVRFDVAGGGGTTAVVAVAVLRDLPALSANPPSFTVSQAGWHVLQDGAGNDWGVALRGTRLWVASDLDPAPRNLPFSVYLSERTGQLEDFAAADRDDRVPEAKMPTGWKAFTQGLLDKLNGIEDGAQANVQANLAETDSTSPAYVKGKDEWAAALPRGVPVATLPAVQPDASTKVLVEEARDRRDAVISLADVGGQEYWGLGRGALVAPLDSSGARETAAWNAAVKGLIWDSGNRTLFAWLDGDSFDKVVLNGQTHSMTELAQGPLTWDAGPNPAQYRRVQIVVSADEATAVDDGLLSVKLNFQDSTASLHQSFLVGNPYIREAKRADDRLNAAQVDARIGLVIDPRVYTQAEFDAIADKGSVVRFVS